MITGMGAVSPIGKNVKECFDNAVKGVCGIKKAQSFDTELTGHNMRGRGVGLRPLAVYQQPRSQAYGEVFSVCDSGGNAGMGGKRP